MYNTYIRLPTIHYRSTCTLHKCAKFTFRKAPCKDQLVQDLGKILNNTSRATVLSYCISSIFTCDQQCTLFKTWLCILNKLTGEKSVFLLWVLFICTLSSTDLLLVFVSLYSQYLENYLWPNFISTKVCKLLSDM